MVKPHEYVELSLCEPCNGHTPMFGFGAVPNLMVPHEGPDHPGLHLQILFLQVPNNSQSSSVVQEYENIASIKHTIISKEMVDMLLQ